MSKISLHIALLFVACACFAQTNVLDKQILLTAQNYTVKDILEEVAGQTNIIFSYSNQSLEEDKLISVSSQPISLKNLLENNLINDSIQFTVVDNKIIIYPRQKNEALQIIKFAGKILENKTLKPIPFATITLKNTNYGVIANNNGDFLLNIPSKYINNSIQISSIGYVNQEIPIYSMLKDSVNIYLTPAFYKIKPAIIRPLDANKIIASFEKNIQKNYGSPTVTETGFFRESIKQNNNYLSVVETVVQIEKESVISGRRDKAYITKGRKSISSEQSTIFNFTMQGSIYNHLQLDIVKYKPDFLDPDQMIFYQYSVKKITGYNNKQAYVIEFEPQPYVSFPCYEGQLYIDIESLALIAADFSLTSSTRKYANKTFVKKAPLGVQIKINKASYHVKYLPDGNSWRLVYLRGDVICKLKKELFNFKGENAYQTISELAITGIDSSEMQTTKKDIVTWKDILNKKVTNLDPDYWGANNILLPEQPIEKTIEKTNMNKNLWTEVKRAAAQY